MPIHVFKVATILVFQVSGFGQGRKMPPRPPGGPQGPKGPWGPGYGAPSALEPTGGSGGRRSPSVFGGSGGAPGTRVVVVVVAALMFRKQMFHKNFHENNADLLDSRVSPTGIILGILSTDANVLLRVAWIL